jgi:hypothetical protein
VARRIGDDELPSRCREIAIGDVDGDLLLALGLQPVDQKRKVERPCPSGAREALAVLGRLDLVLEDEMRIVEEPADQRALAVIDAAASEEAQQAAIFLGRDPGLDLAARVLLAATDDTEPRHQK